MKVNYENSTGLLAVIGDPIRHSLSPRFQNTMLEILGEDRLYIAVEVPAGTVGKFVEAAKTVGITGFNLTMPHKEDIIPLLDSMTPEAAACASVNSVRIRDGRLEGHSTDGIGFRRALADFGTDYDGKIVTLFGAGGAAKSVAMTAAMSGAKEVRVVNRTLARAEKLCAGHENMRAIPIAQRNDVLGDTDILVNCTPIGMTGTAGGDTPKLDALKKDALCMDCIYSPAMTPFMAEARRTGHDAGNGIGMLVYQAVYALEFFLNREFDPDTVTALGKKLFEVSGVDPRGL